MTKSFEFTASAEVFEGVRNVLKDEVLQGRKIKFTEGLGWIKRIFSVTGEPADVDAVRERLADHALRMAA